MQQTFTQKGHQVRFTKNIVSNCLYIIVLKDVTAGQWNSFSQYFELISYKGEEITINLPHISTLSKFMLLGYEGELHWRYNSNEGFTFIVPIDLKHAISFKLCDSN